jgi:hypothetical protein
VTTSSRLRHRVTIAIGVATVAVIAAAIIVPLSLSSGSSQNVPVLHRARGLHVMPFPGTLAASPQTQIVFSSLRPRQIRSLKVTGSASGPHPGRMIVLPLHRGTAFVPASRFEGGEQVTVQARLSSPAAGTAVGAPNSTHISFNFTVGENVNGNIGASSADVTPSAIAKRPRGEQLKSAPALHPPPVKVSGADPDPSAGKIFVTPNNGQQYGPMILNSQGQSVWFRPLKTGLEASDLEVQRYHGKPVLTWWQGVVVAGHGVGEDVMLDQHYNTVAVVHAGDGYSADLHEFKVTPEGTAFVTSFNAVKANLTSVGGKAHGESLFDSVIQEIYIPTGQVLWEWHSLGHVPISDSYMGTPTPGQPYDYFHANAVQPLPNGNLLVTARNTWAVYEIDRATGKIVWQLGGKRSDYKLGQGAQFEWEHDGELHNGLLTVFDDADSPKEEQYSRAIVLRPNNKDRTASLVHSYIHKPGVLSGSQGNMQPLPNGNVFVGWGADPDFAEYTSQGRQILNFTFQNVVNSYRAYRFAWSGQPSTPPAAAVKAGPNHQLTVYVSWNGATNVASWQLLAGSSPSTLSPVSKAPRQGFETAIHTSTRQPYVAVQALSRSGAVLGTSSTIHSSSS